MESIRANRRIWAVAAVALLGAVMVPGLAGAATSGPAAAPATSSFDGSWAYGGQSWATGGFSSGSYNLTWNASFGVVVLFNATNTSTSTIEITEQRTVAFSVVVSFSGPNSSFTYRLKALEVDAAYANLTRNGSVTLSNGSAVAALGLLNASAASNGSLAESLVGTHNGSAFSGYLNVSGHAGLRATFAPALGLVPLNLTPATGAWSSTSWLNATSAWAFSVQWARHGPSGSAGNSSSGGGGANVSENVTLYGSSGAEAMFHDHVARIQVVLALGGPFSLRDGFVLVPAAFDFFGASVRPYATAEIGAGAISTDDLYLAPGHIGAGAFGAAQVSFVGSGMPLTLGGAAGVLLTAGTIAPSQPAGTVTAQPESPSQARAQASCLQFGCGAVPKGWNGADVALAALVAAAIVGSLVLLARRGRPRSPTTEGGSIGGRTSAPPTEGASPATPPTGGRRQG